MIDQRLANAFLVLAGAGLLGTLAGLGAGAIRHGGGRPIAHAAGKAAAAGESVRQPRPQAAGGCQEAAGGDGDGVACAFRSQRNAYVG